MTTVTCAPGLDERRFWLGLSAAFFAAWALGLAGYPLHWLFTMPWQYMLYWLPLVGVFALDRRCALRPVYQASLGFAFTQILYMSYGPAPHAFTVCAVVQGLAIGLQANRQVTISAVCAGLILTGDLYCEGLLGGALAGHALWFTGLSAVAARVTSAAD